MKDLKALVSSLHQAICEERSRGMNCDKEKTDRLFYEVVEALGDACVHEHQQPPLPAMSSKERDLLLMSHASHSYLKTGRLNPSSEHASAYMSGHMDGQRKTLSIMNGLANALQSFRTAHPCPDESRAICPTNREAQQALERFDEWKQSKLIPAIIGTA